MGFESAVKDELDDDDIFQESDSDDEGAYKPRPQLPQPNVNMRSLGSLIKDLENGVIDVDPEYQREVVWTADRMTGLINSLMENYYIPPIILNKKKIAGPNSSKARDTLVCVDGKQRLSSVRAFVKGMIPCHNHRGEKWWFCDTQGTKSRRKVLPVGTQKSFLEKDFVAFQFTELTLVQEEDLFARVQMGMQLTAAEKMRAQTGPWQELAKLFVDDFPVIYSMMKDKARAKDFQLTLACFSQIVEVMHPTTSNGIPMLKTSYSSLSKLLSNTGAVDDATKSHFASVWNTFKELIEHDPDTFTNADKHLRGVQTFAPVEMVAVTVLISMYSETRNNELLLGDIKALREALREHFTDLRLNTTVWKFIWEYIDDLEAIRGAVGSTMNRNISKQPLRTAASSATTTVPTATSKPAVQKGGEATHANPLSVLTPRKKIAVKKEKQSSGLPSPKRQRTDAGPSTQQAFMVDLPNGSTISSHITNSKAALQEHRRWVQPADQPLTISTTSAYQSPYHSTPTSPVPPNTLTLPQRKLTPGQAASSYPISASGTLAAAMSQSGSAQAPGQLRQGFGAYAPTHTDQEWQGITKSVSPEITSRPAPQDVPTAIPTAPLATASTTPPLAPRATNNKKRKSITRPAPAQYDGAIDLTSDTELEEERQNLLSSFKGSTATGKQPQLLAASAVSRVHTRSRGGCGKNE